MTQFTRLLLHKAERQREYFANPAKYAQKIKHVALKLLPQSKIYLFGSAVYGKAMPGSDIDLLIVSEKISGTQIDQAKIKVKLQRAIGKDAPFEIHLTTPEGFLWYKRFAKKMIEV